MIQNTYNVLDPHVYACLTWSLSPQSPQVCMHASMHACKYVSMKIRLKENKDGKSLISIHFSRKWKEISESSDSTRCFPTAKVTIVRHYKF